MGSLSLVVVFAALSSSGVAAATPFCFETGPGYQKCVTSGHDLTPIYEGPKVYDGGNAPWVPSAPPPVYIPAPPPIETGTAAGLPAPIPAGTPGPRPGDFCPELSITTQDGIGQTMWCNPTMTGDHSLVWMYGGPG